MCLCCVALGSKHKSEAEASVHAERGLCFLTANQCLFNIWGVASSSLLKLIGSSALWAWLCLHLPVGSGPKLVSGNRPPVPVLAASQGSSLSPL